MNVEAVCRTAPATPGLSMIIAKTPCVEVVNINIVFFIIIYNINYKHCIILTSLIQRQRAFRMKLIQWAKSTCSEKML